MHGSPRPPVLAGALVVAATALAACSGDSPIAPGSGLSTVKVEITNTAPVAGYRAHLAKAIGWGAVPAGVGEAAPEKLEYFITNLRLCESVETNGTAFNNTQGCIDIYNNQSVDYDSYGFAEARADNTPGHYFDLMDPSTTSALSQSVPVQAGSYGWALATWNRPVRVQASIPLAGGGSLYTKDGEPGQNGTVTTQDLHTGPSELAITDLSNGGTWFRLQSPFVIPDSGASYTLTLAFNPDRLMKASASDASNASIQDTTAARAGIYVPMLDLTPVLHRSDEQVRKETYLLTGQAQFTIRLELYSMETDPAKTIVGVDVKTLYTGATTLNLMHPARVSFLSSALDGSTTFEIWDHSPMIQGFTGSATGGTVTVDCQVAFFGLDACGGSPSATLSYAAPEVTILP
jgi:hypothetical protein